MAKLGFEENLGEKVIAAGKCAGCSACVITCPPNVLEYVDEKPQLKGECIECGICVKVCPNLEFNEEEMDEFVFGRTRRTDETFGVYRKLYLARAVEENILNSCQDGGLVTAIIKYSLDEGLIDGAAVSGLDDEKPFYAVPKLISEPSEAVLTAGTRYNYSPNLIAYKEGVESKMKSLALVGTPCQIRALRKIAKAGLKRYSGRLKFTIGLFCSECFDYDSLFESVVKERLGLDPHRIRKMNIKGGMIISTETEDFKLPLREVKSYARKECDFCRDFSAEYADLSAGGVGLRGWTLTVVRSDVGEDLLNQAVNAGVIEVKPVEEGSKALDLLVKLSRIKKK